jgi:hypothetical protein
VVFGTAIIILLWLLFAQHNGWWPYQRPHLGSAFYTNIGANTPAPAGSTDSSDGSSSSSDNDGSNSGGGNGGGSTNTPSSSDSILDFAGQVNVGSSKTQINTKASRLGQKCAVIATAQTSTAGKQEVCTYTDGDKIVTVTYLNDRVISASKSGLTGFFRLKFCS